MNIDIPRAVVALIGRLEAAGHEAWAVGGCVRDSLMGRAPKDWDLCTSAPPLTTRAVFSCDCPVIDTGLKHGTVTVVYESEHYEVTTYRVDGAYTDGRRPDSVAFTPSLVEDLKRRDFTINAMACHPTRGLCDPFGGRADIERRLIRCVGDPMHRFGEDALRILRALRFAIELGFAIDENTARAMSDRAYTVARVSPERRLEELRKALVSAQPMAAVLRAHEQAARAWLSAPPDEAADRCGGDPIARLALLYRFDVTGCAAEQELRALRASRDYISQVPALVRALDMPIEPPRGAALRALGRLGAAQAERLSALHAALFSPGAAAFADELARARAEDACCTVRQLKISGHDLAQRGLSGQAVGETLANLLEEVIDGRLPNERPALLAAINGKYPVI